LVLAVLTSQIFKKFNQFTMKQLKIPTNKGGKVVLVSNIIRVEASSCYSKVYFSDERPLLVAKVLQWFENHLPEEIFCRIHRTHLVNRMYVSGVYNRSSVTLVNGEIIQISRRKKGEYQFPADAIAIAQSALHKN
jgi:two-component system, LytTR family, response regulator